LNRYAGDASVVANADLRIAIGSFNSVLPMRFAISEIGDMARVLCPGVLEQMAHRTGPGLWAAILVAVPGYRIIMVLNTLVVASN
jgi:hypothetical protein